MKKPKEYNESDVCELFKKAIGLNPKDKLHLEKLYQEDILRERKSKIQGSEKKCYQKIAQYLTELDISGYESFEVFFEKHTDRSKRIARKNGFVYKTGHNLETQKKEGLKEKEKADKEGKTLREKMLAKTLLKKTLNPLGEIIDLEIPLNEEDGGGLGEIDLLAYNKEKGILTLIELKRKDNEETILRAILEISTYYCQVNRKILVKEYGKGETQIKKAVLIYENSFLHEQFKESDEIKKLATLLNVNIFLLNEAESAVTLAV